MGGLRALIDEHDELTRRYFVRLGATGLALSGLSQLARSAEPRSPELAALLDSLEYLTRPEEFGTVERGNPLPYKLPAEKLRAVGLIRETWQLEVVPDPDSDAKIDRPMSKRLGTALDWKRLMKLAQTRAVRYMKVMTCNNGERPLGMGLWEGVPGEDRHQSVC